MLEVLYAGKRVYNIDESWLDSINFTRRNWPPKLFAVETSKAVSPRISMIACVGSDGTVLYSLTQVNTDHKVFCCYLTELVRRLTIQEPDWRANSVFLLE
jgi:hypothetical protein